MNQQWKSLCDQHVFYTTYQTPENPKAILFIIHGMSEHRHRYIAFTNQLNQAGYATLTIDLRGHGDSPMGKDLYGDFGEHGMEYMIEDFHQVVSYYKEETKLPVFVYGHSMGSLFARAYVLTYPDDFNALILTGSPWLPNGLGFLKVLIGILSPFMEHKPAKLIADISNKAFLKDIKNPKTPYDWISFNSDNFVAYNEDERCGFPFTINGYRTLVQLFSKVYASTDHPIAKKIPLLFLYGEHDPCVAIDQEGDKKAVAWLHSHGLKDITIKRYNNSRHELINDLQREEVINDMISFLNNQV